MSESSRQEKLSPTMQAAADYAQKHGGLQRFPGGYWCEPGRTQWDAIQSPQSFSTSTVQALVARGVAEYTEWRDGRNGRFPIRIALSASRGEQPTVKASDGAGMKE